MGKVYLSTILKGNDNVQLIIDTIEIIQTDIGIEYFASEINDLEERKIKELNKIFKNLPSTFHSPMRYAEPTADEFSSEYYSLIENWERILKLCQAFGSSTIVFHTNNCFIEESERLKKQENAKRNCLFLNEMSKSYGVTLLVETLALPGKGAPIYTNQEYIDFIINNNLFALIDIGHMNINGYDYEYTIKNLNKRILAYHLHNNDGIDDTHQSIRNGTFDYQIFIDLFKSYTPNADLIFEYIEIPNLTAHQLAEDINYLVKKIKS
ncbi:MAG: sugar phosphate isomerase/epimerase [Bacilli bacterium]|nr:sugar phosphate isomerase/epimerase [Bacilli bacterium]